MDRRRRGRAELLCLEKNLPESALRRREWKEAKVETHIAGNIFIHFARAERLPLADQSFDMLQCIEVIEHLAARQDALREMWRVLRPHGKLLVSVPLLPPPFYHLDHVVQGFSREEILHELELAGFSIIKEDVALLRWSRWVLRMCHRTGLPLPLLFICHLENRVFSKRSNRIEQKPLDILLLVQKSDLVQ